MPVWFSSFFSEPKALRLFTLYINILCWSFCFSPLSTHSSVVKDLICAERPRPASGKFKHSEARQENNEKTVTPVYSWAVNDKFLCYQSGGISIKPFKFACLEHKQPCGAGGKRFYVPMKGGSLRTKGVFIHV